MEINVFGISVIALVVVCILMWLWYLWGRKAYRSYYYKHKLHPELIAKVNEIITDIRAKYYIMEWLDKAGLIHYTISDEDFNANYGKAISEIVAKVKEEREEEIQAKINTEYYERQSRNRKDTDPI